MIALKSLLLTVGSLLAISTLFITPGSVEMATFKDNSYEPKPYRQLYQQSVDHVNNTIDRHISETLEARTVKLKTLTEKLKTSPQEQQR